MPLLRECDKYLKEVDENLLDLLRDSTKHLKDYSNEIEFVEQKILNIELLLIVCITNLNIFYSCSPDQNNEEYINSLIADNIVEKNKFKSITDILNHFKEIEEKDKETYHEGGDVEESPIRKAIASFINGEKLINISAVN